MIRPQPVRILCFVLTVLFLSIRIHAERPNIVLLLADDLGWTGLGSFGSDFYETPNLDRMAARGLKFTNAYSACTVCSPTRASIVTGMYPARLRLTDFIAGQHRPFAKMAIPDWTKGLEPGLTTLAEALKAGGYRTIHIGKWHLDFPNRDNQGPMAHGFEVTHEKPAGTQGYIMSSKMVRKLGLTSNYTTDYLTYKAVEEINKTGNQPFFLYFGYNVPHTPIHGRSDLVEYFMGKLDPSAIHKNPIYAAMMKSQDTSVGRILEALEGKGVADNTLVVFISDNGGLTQRFDKHDRFTENLPLRRGKGSAYEGGVRVPGIAYWPGNIQAGQVSETPIMSIDLYPTFIDVAEIAGDSDHKNKMDGLSLLSVFRNPAHTYNRDLFWHYPHYHAGGDGPYSAVRSGDWKLIDFHEDRPCELYNLSYNISESVNLVGRYPEKLEELKSKLDQWRHSVKAQMSAPNPNHDPDRETVLAKNSR